MPQSLARVLVHIVFSTRDRRAHLDDQILPQMQAYMASIVNHSEHVLLRIGGIADHIHIAVFLARTESIARLVERLKVASSKWVKSKGPEYADFGWQSGYAVFSVGLSDKTALIHYIDNQHQHHQRKDFQTELRAMLVKYDVAYDERYIWD